jgi:hypothetical protein
MCRFTTQQKQATKDAYFQKNQKIRVIFHAFK